MSLKAVVNKAHFDRWVIMALPGRSRRSGRGLAIAGGAVVVAVGFRLALQPVLDEGFPFITFFPAILIASVWGGTGAGVGALAAGSVFAAYAWLAPTWSLTLTPRSIVALVAFWIFGGILILVAAMLRMLVQARIEAQERSELLAHEMKHRVGNMLGVVQAIARQTVRNARSLDDFQDLFTSRLNALATAQNLLAERPDLPLDLESLLGHVLVPFGIERFTMHGPPTAMAPALGTSLALLIHELATNAVKYGALSVPDGSIAIDWTIEGGRARIEWRESDGPPVDAPRRTGFGSRLLKSAFPPSTGDASILYDPAGVRCTITFLAG